VLSVFEAPCPKLNLEFNEDEQSGRSDVLFSKGHVGRRRANAELVMCEKCKELDQKIEHYQELSRSITDQPTIDSLNELIRDLYERKIALHTSPAEQKK
jgi:hypothetical protein